MNIFEIINNLYTNRKSDWILELDDESIQPYVIQRWLSMNDEIRAKVSWLDKYVFHLKPKMYLSLAWSIIAKRDRAPFVRYIKQVDEDEEYDFILLLIRKHFALSDNDYRANKSRIVKQITKDAKSMVEWFTYYGIPKRYWKQFQLDFNLIKQGGVAPVENKSQRSLASWGL